MVDRGGLNYPIRVSDEFSKTTTLFRKEIRASKKEFRDFQKVVAGNKSAAKGIRNQAKATMELARAQAALAKATKSAVKPMTDEERAAKALEAQNKKLARSLAELARQQKVRERVAVALRNAQNADLRREKARIKTVERLAKADLKAAQAKDADFQATKRNTAALFQQTVALKQVAQLKARARVQFGQGDILGGADTLRRAKDLEKTLRKTQNTAQKLLFTFRRLVGALAIFTLARKGAQAFNDLVSAGIKFNDTIATSQLGIAGLVATLGDVRDAQGQSVSATEELNLALGIAREQTKALRQDSLKTVATFEQLLDTFQVSVGPGLAAGLDLDEVRKITVDISQAASALGVPQNQLAEEVRSLLSGTIQARTTRIATALGITNEDIRRLKETGELFDFLEEKFAGFAEAAQRQARETFSGIRTLITGLVQEILGKAAQPLFAELVSLGNGLFDNLLSVKDAVGNIKPSPDVVAAFQQIFDAIKRSVQAFSEFGRGSVISGLETTLALIATTIDFITGAVVGLVEVFGVIRSVIAEIAEFFGLTSDNTAETVKQAGRWLVIMIAVKKALSAISLSMLKIAGRAGIVVAAFVAIAKGVEFVLEKILGIDLGIRDTIQLITLGLIGAWITVSEVVSTLVEQITTGLSSALDFVITQTMAKARTARGFIQSLFGDADAKERAEDLNAAEQVHFNARKLAREKEHKVALKDIVEQAAAKQKGIEAEIAAKVADRTTESNKGGGFRPGFDPVAAAKAAADAAKTFVSTADKPISELGNSLSKVNDQIDRARREFEQASRAAQAGGVGGVAGGIGAAFDKQEIANAERLEKIRTSLADTEREIAALRAAGLGDDSGAIVSALRDEKDLRDAINIAEQTSVQLAGLKAAALATRALPALREEAATLQASVAAERAKTAAVVSGAGARELALIAATSAVALAQQELTATAAKNQLERQSIALQAAKLPPGEELDALNAVIDALAIRQGFEEEILRLRLGQLGAAQREADLVANGSLTDGLKEGFEQFGEQFGSTFNAGLEIARQGVTALTQFASQAIVDAFDPTKEVDIKERFARLMQSIAQTILQQLIQLAIAKAILGFKDGGVVPEMSAGGVALSFAKGGQVPDHYSKRAQGLAGGGMARPGHIPASDTVAAWLTPGEFVMNKTATSENLSMLQAMNGGNMSVVGSSSAEAAGPSTGMAAGGIVADQIANVGSGGESDGPVTIVVPAIVARDREMDAFAAGGKNALLAFMRDNAGNINTLLDRSGGRS